MGRKRVTIDVTMVNRIRQMRDDGLTMRRIRWETGLCLRAIQGVVNVLNGKPKVAVVAPVVPQWTPRKCSLPEPENLKIELIDLGPQMCTYPNAVDPPPYEFCGQPTVYGPYCPYHSAIVWTTGAPARTQAPDAAHTSAS